ncbi:MAG: NAD-dependent epimerase/dehydratase family protein [bacterium]|nr:NAD-dependent epimerase/dehydratase family protein [bacterium]
MRIIVTGGAGFIGSHIADRYIEAGHDVVVVDNLWDHGGGRRENVNPRASFVHMDIRDPELGRVFHDVKPEVVSHHAAQHSVAISARDPLLDAQVNMVGFLNVLSNAVKTGARKVIYASSGATFGTPDQLPIDESTPQHPESPYGISKMAGEHYLRFFKAQHGLDFTALRYGNVYGPRQDPNGEAGVISIFIGKFLSHDGITIFWDGEQTRDYVYVKDVAEANLLALNAAGGEMLCIGTNKRTSVNQIFLSLKNITGFDAPVIRAPQRPGDARDAQFNCARARDILGWTPQTKLLDGMRETVEFFRKA